MRTLTIALLAAASLCAADLDNNTVTVTATRPLDTPPDRAGIRVQLDGPADTGLEEILALLKGTGITASDLTYVYGRQNDPDTPTATWIFQVNVSLATLPSTMAVLTQLQKSLGSRLIFDIAGTLVSRLPACPLPALVSDARKQAESMALAAGMKVGPIVSMSDVPLVQGMAAGVGSPQGVISQPVLTGVFTSLVITYPAPDCALTVQFKLQ